MKRFIILSLGISLLTACASTPSVDSLYDKDADFSDYRTFGFAETRSEKESKYSSLMDKFLKSAISDELTARGYKPSDEPDLLINFHVSSKDKTDIYDFHRPSLYYQYRYIYGYAPWPYYTTETRVNQYTEGTLNIDLVDAGQKQLVWEGVAIGRVSNQSLKNLEARVNAAVKLIFEKYPFRAGTAEPVIPDSE